MSNKFDEMRQAVNEAQTALKAADEVASVMGSLLVGRLRHCSHYDLAHLKRELQNFDARTGKWNRRGR